MSPASASKSGSSMSNWVISWVPRRMPEAAAKLDDYSLRGARGGSPRPAAPAQKNRDNVSCT